MTKARMTGWKRTQDGWTEEPCDKSLPLTLSTDSDVGDVVGCQRTVPTRNGKGRPHRDHWWEGELAGCKTSITWKE